MKKNKVHQPISEKGGISDLGVEIRRANPKVKTFARVGTPEEHKANAKKMLISRLKKACEMHKAARKLAPNPKDPILGGQEGQITQQSQKSNENNLIKLKNYIKKKGLAKNSYLKGMMNELKQQKEKARANKLAAIKQAPKASEAEPSETPKYLKGRISDPVPYVNPKTVGGMKKDEKPFKGYNPKKHSKSGGLNDKAREKYNRETGSNLKRPVTGDVKPGSKAAKRRKSFCARMKGVKGPTSEGGKLTPKGAALRRWKC